VPGSRKGIPNRATQAAREAIGRFVDGNAHRLQGWLDAIAGGSKGTNSKGEEVWLAKPNPALAFELFQSVIEYHVPKLARTELTGKDNSNLALDVRIRLQGSDGDQS
jgi:hypothetical protein